MRVQTGVYVAAFLRDGDTLAALLTSLGLTRANGLPRRIPARAREILAAAVSSASGASWIATTDHVMRKAAMNVRFRIPRQQRSALGGMSSATVKAQVLVTQVGERQDVGAPPKRQPFSNLAAILDALGDDEDARARR